MLNWFIDCQLQLMNHPCMSSHVISQPSLLCEALRAFTTLVRLLPRVAEHVSPEVSRAGERHAAL